MRPQNQASTADICSIAGAQTLAQGDLEWPTLTDDGGIPKRIADQLAAAIIEGRLASGTRLSELAIAKSFGISRTPVREALYILERDELVARPPRKGARVAEVTAKQALDVYVCRAYLYGLSARMSAPVLSHDDLSQLGHLVDAMAAAVRSEDVPAYYRLNLDFHDYVGRSTGNELLLKLMGGLGRLTLRFRFMSLTIPGRLGASLEAHQRLLDDFGQKDATHAELRVREIVSDAGDAVLSHFFADTSQPVRRVVLTW